jgi:purine-nucleoside phosphorylase
MPSGRTICGDNELDFMTDSTGSSSDMIDQAAEALKAGGVTGPIDCALILGTGLGRIAEEIETIASFAYADIPGFPAALVSGHEGRLIFGRLARRTILIFQGRAHYYETGNAAAMRIPIGVIKALGAPPLLITNAAGSTRQHIRPGSLVAITDHIALGGPNPLIGERGDERFVSMVDAYDPRLRSKLKRAATAAGIVLNEGVYMWFSGPSFETPAEIRMARTLGADLVGMSTVPEVILARRYGLKVAALSVITNLAAGVEGGAPSHAATRGVAAGATASLRRLIHALLAIIDHA